MKSYEVGTWYKNKCCSTALQLACVIAFIYCTLTSQHIIITLNISQWPSKGSIDYI